MSFHLLTAQTLTQADRIQYTAGTTETNIPAYAFIPANAMPSADSASNRDGCVEIHWRLHAFSNTTVGTNADTVTFKLYAGPTPGNTATATAMWTAPAAFTIPRDAVQGCIFEFVAHAQRCPSTTIYAYTKAEWTYTPSSTIDADTTQTWTWNPGAQSASLIGLRDGPFYLWLTATFGSNLASGTFDAKTTVVKAYGLQIPE